MLYWNIGSDDKLRGERSLGSWYLSERWVRTGCLLGLRGTHLSCLSREEELRPPTGWPGWRTSSTTSRPLQPRKLPAGAGRGREVEVLAFYLVLRADSLTAGECFAGGSEALTPRWERTHIEKAWKPPFPGCWSVSGSLRRPEDSLGLTPCTCGQGWSTGGTRGRGISTPAYSCLLSPLMKQELPSSRTAVWGLHMACIFPLRWGKQVSGLINRLQFPLNVTKMVFQLHLGHCSESCGHWNGFCFGKEALSCRRLDAGPRQMATP